MADIWSGPANAVGASLAQIVAACKQHAAGAGERLQQALASQPYDVAKKRLAENWANQRLAARGNNHPTIQQTAAEISAMAPQITVTYAINDAGLGTVNWALAGVAPAARTLITF